MTRIFLCFVIVIIVEIKDHFRVVHPFTVLYEDNHLLVVNKPPGMLVQGDNTGDRPLVDLCKDYIKEKYAKPGAVFMGLVHRIDRPVSGIVVLARTSKALERMTELFREKQTRKTYWAVVRSKPKLEQGVLEHWLIKDEKKNKTTAFSRETRGALRSALSYRLIAAISNEFLLEVNPVTGRPHQIRVQLSMINAPIKGDIKYGDVEANADGSICLHARKLEFLHPVKKEPMVILAPLPSTSYWKPFTQFT